MGPAPYKIHMMFMRVSTTTNQRMEIVSRVPMPTPRAFLRRPRAMVPSGWSTGTLIHYLPSTGLTNTTCWTLYIVHIVAQTCMTE